MAELKTGVRRFVFVAACVGLGCLALALYGLPGGLEWGQAALVLIVLGLEALRIDLFTYRGAQQGAISPGLAGIFLGLALYGPATAVLLAVIQVVWHGLTVRPRWYKLVVNLAAATGATWLAGALYAWVSVGADPWRPDQLLLGLAAVAVYYAFNTGAVAAAIALAAERPLGRVWRDSFSWLLPQHLIIGLSGLALGHAVTALGWLSAAALGLPILLLPFICRSYVARIAGSMQALETANQRLESLNHELKLTNIELIETLAAVIDARDAYTYGHSQQVARYAMALGEKLGMRPDELSVLRQGALLHDIGKVGVAEQVLFKPGGLDEGELQQIRRHPQIGYRIASQVRSLHDVAEIIQQHHEWYGGGGYPYGLRGEEISLGARIVHVAEVLDTMISDRPYRKGCALTEALAELQRGAGTQFDPRVVAALEALVQENGAAWCENSAELVRATLLQPQPPAAAGLAGPEGR